MASNADTLPAIWDNEFPTWSVLAANYCTWILLTWYHAAIPWWLLLFLGGFCVCLHGSLQHEFLHGHPTRSPRLNGALVWAPLGLWMPYTIYRDSHIAHHGSDSLTDPLQDPESFYIAAADWRRLPAAVRALLIANNTLAGRLIIGPVISVGRFWFAQVRQLLAGDKQYAAVWVWHLAGCVAVLYWVTAVCGMSLWQYVLLFAWPGLSITLLRSFTEHRPAANPDQRTIIVEGSWLTRLLFLNNNYHHVHHADPGLAWNRIKRRYEENREQVNSENGGFYVQGYADLFKCFLFKVKDVPVYPNS